MASITINEGPYRGEWPLDLGQSFTILEWRWIKKISGYLPLTLEDGFSNLDPDLFLALTVIALARAGKVRPESVLDVAHRMEGTAFDGSMIVFDAGADNDDEGDDAGPPPVLATEPLPSSSGGSSSPPVDVSADDLSPIGHPV